MEQTKMDEIVSAMTEYVCDELCRHPRRIKDAEELDQHCGSCLMGNHICNILNTYNELNDFDKSQSAKLLQELGRVKEVNPNQLMVSLGDGVVLTLVKTNQMEHDFADCARCASVPGPGKDCTGCSLNVDIFGNSLCELPAVTEQLGR